MKHSLIYGAVLVALLQPVAYAATPADTVYRNGYIYTVDAKDSVQQALAVRAGRIVYVGSDAGLKAYTGKHTKVVDLQQRMVMPGLVDSHMHPLAGGTQLLSCNLNYEALTIAQFQERIQACLDQDANQDPRRWLTVVNWFQQNMVPAGTEANFATLDALKTQRPIMVTSSFLHSSLLNSRAMQLAGIVRETPDPVAGKIVRDAAGNATGILEDTAQGLASDQLPKPTAQDNVAAARAALAALRKQGVTSFLDAFASDESMSAFAATLSEGSLTARAHFAPGILPQDGGDAVKAVSAVRKLASRYVRRGTGAAPGIAVSSAKLFLDGVIAAPALTGAMLEPYNINKGTASDPHWVPGTSKGPDIYFPPVVLKTVLLALARAGIDPHMHVDGDAAVRAALDALQALRASPQGRNSRPVLAHNEIVAAADFPRYQQLNATAVQSFQWEKPAPDTLAGLQGYLEPARYATIEPAGRLQQAGARIAFGSDWPVDALDEWFALKVGMTRTNAADAGAQFAGRLGDDPGLSAATVIRAATYNAAYTLRAEHQIGSLERGKLADLIVLDRNFFQIPPEEVANIKVLQTVVGGKIVYQDPAFRP